MPTRGPQGLARSRRRAVMLVVALGAALPALASIAPVGRAATPEVLLGRNRIGEFQGIRGDNFVAWQQNTRRDPGHYDVFARPIGGGEQFQVNAEGTNGANGDIDGDLLVYQQFRGKRSDIRFFDLAGQQRSSPPRGVNTGQWEYWPSLSGDHLLFGRLSNGGVRRIVLFDLATRTSNVLDRLSGRDSFLAPGQINGDYAAWYRCVADRRCDVIRYHIPDEAQERIENPGRNQRAPAIGPDGTIYFARARGDCGSGVRLISLPLGGPETELWRLPSGDDIGSTHVYVAPNGETFVYYDHYACDQAAVSDVWQITAEPNPTGSPTPPATTPPATTPPATTPPETTPPETTPPETTPPETTPPETTPPETTPPETTPPETTPP